MNYLLSPNAVQQIVRSLLLFLAILYCQERLRSDDFQSTGDDSLLTVAESSGFKATSSYAHVNQFCERLSDASDVVYRFEIGETVEGRQLPALVLSDTAVDSIQDVRESGRLVVLALANIHAGEVCGKEALMILARHLSKDDNRPVLKQVSVVLVPIYNADGNERLGRRNRPNQQGPEQGVGERNNAQGLDLNRDHVKLESPEARSLVRLLNDLDPHVVIDCHTTNGSRHRYTLTYDGPRHPATHPGIIQLAREELLPRVGERMQELSGYSSFFYGNFTHDHTRWETYPAEPRYNTQYIGLRQRIGILSEAYSYASFEDRVRATFFFVRSCVEQCAEQEDQIRDALRVARSEQPDEVAIDFESSPFEQPYTVLGYKNADGADVDFATAETHDYSIPFWGTTRVTRSVDRPPAYLIPPTLTAVVANLHQHGVQLEQLREDLDLDVEVYRVSTLERQDEPFQGHRLVELSVEKQLSRQRIPAGTIVVPTKQDLGGLIVNLLEPASRDGLTTWNFFDEQIEPDRPFPVMRVAEQVPWLTAPQLPSADTPPKRRLTFDLLYGSKPPSFSGEPAAFVQWIDDDHYLQSRDGQMHRVHAATGRAERQLEMETLQVALKGHELFNEEIAQQVADGDLIAITKARDAVLFRHLDDLFYATLDGNKIVRLTQTPGHEELATFSPDGSRVAFVRSNDLYAATVSNGHEFRLTHDGSSLVRNGKADWVYFEEIYNRRWKAFRWSPDSRQLLFQRFDDSPVGTFVVPDNGNFQQEVERERYPKAGQPNPLVRLGAVSSDGGPVQWVDLTRYSPDAMLITHFGWRPDGVAYLYVQDRTQRWLDFNQWSTADVNCSVLFREETKAWVDNPGDPIFRKDNSFLLTSERNGWKHLYLFDSAGKNAQQITDGCWEIRAVHGMDPKETSVFFSATKDSHLATNLYRVQLEGGDVRRLSPGAGSHRTILNPSFTRFVDSVSDHRTPTQVYLRNCDGQLLRMVDTNPVAELRDYDLRPVELIQIKTRDGVMLEASLIKPPGFDPERRYPVWLMTYGGPHAPSLRDAWYGGRTFEQLLAHMGVIAFRCDPRSASGKGAVSTWSAYRQLGVVELRDLEDAVGWLRKQPFVDADRIGMSGHSYGGFLTAYALTHSTNFCAGIAGAPVTDWRNYDTIYTERYMSTPQDNPDGYRKTSVVESASQLHGKLLLLHGARDDNVHFANSVQLAHALQEANKQFEMMVYPQNRHGIRGDHYQRLRIDFIRRSLGLPAEFAESEN